MDKICIIEGCGKPVLWPFRKTCSKTCADIWRKLTNGHLGTIRNCSVCDKPFRAHGEQKTCCPQHQKVAVCRRRAARIAAREKERA